MLFSKLVFTVAAFASAAVASPTPAGDQAAPAAGDAAPSGVDAKDWEGCPGNVNVCINRCREKGLGNWGECQGFLLHECHCLTV